jgi:thiamine biosynthesis protein ThiC
MVKRVGKLKDLGELAKLELEEGEEVIVEGIEHVEIVIVPDDEKPKRKVSHK